MSSVTGSTTSSAAGAAAGRGARTLDESADLWLLADVGGTNVRFALAQTAARMPLFRDSVRSYRVADFAGFADTALRYLESLRGSAFDPGGKFPAAGPAHAVVALAGRINGDEAQLTNHSWRVSAAQLRHDLRLDTVRLVNDFAAIGMSLPLLGAADVLAIGPPVPTIVRRAGRRQHFCVLGPGTGLGVSALMIEDDTVIGLETEGGHVGFAPRNEEEIAVLRWLSTRFGRVSLERLLCGSGLANIHQALCAIAGGNAEPLAPEAISARAQAGSDPYCRRAVELFCAVLGAAAGDYALSYGAWDGVYLAGGVLEPLRAWIQNGAFRARFDDKGRFAAAIARVPVALITHPQPGLLGAAGFAVQAAGQTLLREPAQL